MVEDNYSPDVQILYQSPSPLFVSEGGNVSYTVQARDGSISALSYTWMVDDPSNGRMGENTSR